MYFCSAYKSIANVAKWFSVNLSFDRMIFVNKLERKLMREWLQEKDREGEEMEGKKKEGVDEHFF